MRYYEFRYLIEGYPQAQAAFIQAGADTASVQKTIADFKQLVTRNQIKDINQKNIDWWAKQGWDKFSQFVNQAAAVPSKSQIEKKKLPGQSINLVDNAQWFIVIPLDKDASCFHGKNSDWCTTKVHQSYFEQYFYNRQVTLIYCFNKSTGGMWAIAVHKDTDKFEMFDQKDRSLTVDEFKRQTGLDPAQLRDMALGDVHQPKVQATRDKWKDSKALTNKLLNDLPEKTRSSEIEKQLLYNKSRNECLKYIRKIGSIDSNDFPLAIEIAAVSLDSHAIQHIKNPKPIVQKTAVSQYGGAIQYIIEAGITPTEAVQIAAVSNDGSAIVYIIDAGITPSEAVQRAAVSQYGGAILYIIRAGITPTEAVQKTAVSQLGRVIRYIIDAGIKPTEAVQIAAVSNDGLAIEFIIDAGITPSKAVRRAYYS